MDAGADTTIADEILRELLSTLEAAAAQSAALIQFIKDKGIAKEDELAPYLEAAANASDVRSRATRLRMNSLIASALKSWEELIEKKIEQANRKDADVDRRGASAKASKQKPDESSKERAATQSGPKPEAPKAVAERAPKETAEKPSNEAGAKTPKEAAQKAPEQAAEKPEKESGSIADEPAKAPGAKSETKVA
jgi:hypothetical protein